MVQLTVMHHKIWDNLRTQFGEDQALETWKSQFGNLAPPGTSTLERIAAKPHEFTTAPSTRVHDAVAFRSNPKAWLKLYGDVPRFASEDSVVHDEEKLQWAIVKLLRDRKMLAYVFDAGSKSQTARARAGRVPPGHPDIWVLHKGLEIRLEVKLPGSGTFTEAQLEFIPKLVENGAIVHIVHSCKEAWNAVLEHVGAHI
jgi:hypothetical protein